MSHEKHKEVPKEVMGASSDGRLSCRRALELARQLGVSPRIVGRAADEAGIKIRACQLGCFR